MNCFEETLLRVTRFEIASTAGMWSLLNSYFKNSIEKSNVKSIRKYCTDTSKKDNKANWSIKLT